jgi:putative transposase
MQKLHYTHNNPVVAGFIVDSTSWKYSSAINYSGGSGMMDVILID